MAQFWRRNSARNSPTLHPSTLRYADIKHQHKDEAELRAMDKIGYRYP